MLRMQAEKNLVKFSVQSWIHQLVLTKFPSVFHAHPFEVCCVSVTNHSGLPSGDIVKVCCDNMYEKWYINALLLLLLLLLLFLARVLLSICKMHPFQSLSIYSQSLHHKIKRVISSNQKAKCTTSL